MSRRALLFLAILGVAILAVDTGAFTSVSADRGVTVNTASDENAYMALDFGNGAEDYTESDGTLDVVTVTNQFSEAVDVTVHYEVSAPDDSEVAAGEDTRNSLSDGNSYTTTTSFECAGSGEYTVDFNVTAEGSSVYVETTQNRSASYTIC